jgi:pimeloyl-ACP methyl ester carboxylesterase
MAHATQPALRSRHVWLPVAGGAIEGDLAVPDQATGIVLFAHGSGSSRLSPRNRKVARELQDGGLATLLFDLLTPMEEEEEDKRTGRLRFDVNLLAGRLLAVTDLVAEGLGEGQFRIGYFGASTGTAAALIAAAKRPSVVHAVVSRGGRPDLAEEALASVRAPTLLIVGAQDPDVLRWNINALAHLKCVKRMEVVPHATHLFAEPGALDQVSWLARDWFSQHLASRTYA